MTPEQRKQTLDELNDRQLQRLYRLALDDIEPHNPLYIMLASGAVTFLVIVSGAALMLHFSHAACF
jgi:hypothetical protein